MNLPLVSILIPMNNAEKCISQTIKSASAQSWPNKEIIVIDDGSTDHSLEIARAYESEIVKIFTQPNQGGSAARNRAFELSKGEYIQYLDADDLLSPEKIEKQMAALRNRKDYLAICPTVYFFDGDDLYSCTHNEYDNFFLRDFENGLDFLLNLYGANELGKGGMVTVHSWLSPRHLIEKAGPWNESLRIDQDGEFFCRVVLHSAGVVAVHDVFNYYRKFRKNITVSGGKEKEDFLNLLQATDLKLKHLQKFGGDGRVFQVMARAYHRIAIAAFPQFKDISRIALERAENLGGVSHESVIGGPVIETVKKVFGWKTARYISHGKKMLIEKLGS